MNADPVKLCVELGGHYFAGRKCTRCPAVDDRPALFDEAGEPTPEAHARRTDPHTSHEAARSLPAERLRASQDAVLRVLARSPRPRPTGLTDAELVDLYSMRAEAGYEPRQSPSGIRTRRAELVVAGKVVDSGARAIMASGRRAIVWQATP